MKQIIKTLAALVAITATLNAADDCYGTTTVAKSPTKGVLDIPARAFALPGSGGINLSSQPTSEYCTWAARYRITGVTNGVTVNVTGNATYSYTSWLWGDRQYGPEVNVPWAVICNKPANWMRLEVWYFEPGVAQNNTNYVVYTKSECWGVQK